MAAVYAAAPEPMTTTGATAPGSAVVGRGPGRVG